MKALKRFSVGKFHARVGDPINQSDLPKSVIRRLIKSGHITAPEKKEEPKSKK